MEIDEVAARLFRRYWALMLICVAVPIAAIGAVTVRQPPMYAADARIITGSVVPQSSQVAIAVASQVQAIATGRTAVSHALAEAGARRNLADFISNNITVSGLGGSQVVDLTVTDHSRDVAAKVDSVLASEVVGSLNRVGQGGLNAALRTIDDQLVRLSQERAALAQQVASAPRNQQLQAKLAGIDQVIADFTGDRGRLLIQAATQGLAGVIDMPAIPSHPESNALPQKLALAGLLGLVVGILIAAIAETVRPTVPGARRVSRRLGVPLLGELPAGDREEGVMPGIDKLALPVRLGAEHAGVTAVAVTGISDDGAADDLAAALARLMSGSGGPEASLAARAPSGRSPDPARLAAAQSAQEGLAGQDGPNGRAGVLVKVRDDPGAPAGPLAVIPLSQLATTAGAGPGRCGLLVCCGPVARAQEVARIGDLAAASGWPVLGVIGLPRRRSRNGRGRWSRRSRLAGRGRPGGPGGPRDEGQRRRRGRAGMASERGDGQ